MRLPLWAVKSAAVSEPCSTPITSSPGNLSGPFSQCVLIITSMELLVMGTPGQINRRTPHHIKLIAAVYDRPACMAASCSESFHTACQVNRRSRKHKRHKSLHMPKIAGSAEGIGRSAPYPLIRVEGLRQSFPPSLINPRRGRFRLSRRF